MNLKHKPYYEEVPLVWNVYVESVNDREMVVHNVFQHYSLWEDLKKVARKYAKDRPAFEERVRRLLMYYYWSKCEWEIIISEWPPCGHRIPIEKKIDVWDQIEINWPHFIDYLWENAAVLRRRPKKNNGGQNNGE